MIIDSFQDSNIEAIMEIDRLRLNTNWSKDTYLSYLSNDDSLFYVAKIDNQVVGFILFQVGEFHSDLLQIAVKNDYSYKGIGTALLDVCLRTFSENHEIFLEVDKSNDDAIKFYKKNGFEKIGIRKSYYDNGNDAIVYRKVI